MKFVKCARSLQKFVKDKNVLVLPAQIQNSQLTAFYIMRFTTANKKPFRDCENFKTIKEPKTRDPISYTV